MLSKKDKSSSQSLKNMFELLHNLYRSTGFSQITWSMGAMWLIVAILFYLAVYKKFEPLLLIPIAFGALLGNLPTKGMVNLPAETLYSTAEGMILKQSISLGDEVSLITDTPNFPKTVGELESADPESLGTNTLLYILRPLSSPPTAEERIRILNSDTLPTDQLIWADSEGQIVQLNHQVGDYVYTGSSIAELYSHLSGGLFHYLRLGILLEIFPPLIFLGIGALTDFGPLIAKPITLLLGAAAQFGVFITFIGATALGFSPGEAAAIGIIGGADGPTSIFLANALAPELLAPIALAAYSYMALVPLIQPPIMRLLTTRKERTIRMKNIRTVGRLEKIIFALVVTIFCILLVPPAAPLIGMLMFGNLLRESRVTERLSKTAQNELINVVTIFLGAGVGISMTSEQFFRFDTLGILLLGVIAFCVSTAAGILMAKVMNLFTSNKINPLIGSAGVSAVPMAARVSQVEGQKADPNNYLLMHAMGPNLAGVLGTALVAGYFLTVFR
jgi:oxaloacetate decarboxylase beta subunit